MKVYLDNNASTRVDPSVIESMMPFFTEITSPPSSDYGHSFGVEAKQALDSAREIIATKINVDPSEIVFTSGQAESNNFAIKGIAFMNIKSDSKTIIASSVSHSTILDSLKSLKKLGFNTKLIDVDSEGFIDRDQLRKLLSEVDDLPLLVSIPHGNVEIGTVEDIEEIASICHEYNVPIHIEASYSFCKIPFDASIVDMATITSHLIHGPKGVGALYLKKGIKTQRIIDGGLQENKKRGGTENLPGIVGFAKAVELYTPEINEKVKELRNYLWQTFENKISDFKITGPLNKDKRLPNHYSVVINYVEGESILLHLDMLDFMIATGSACSSKQLKASHVLSAIGLPTEISHGSVRIGLSKYNTEEEIDQFVGHLAGIVERLRAISPMNADFMREWQEMKDKGAIEDHHHDFDDLEDD
ncbi:MAG: cysteine desulfurase [Candidatus Heimdallarchaeota archaeon]|nr:MAG: cysteine desulfurase [Candidatus Heimdallarchaeota archaeon]